MSVECERRTVSIRFPPQIGFGWKPLLTCAPQSCHAAGPPRPTVERAIGSRPGRCAQSGSSGERSFSSAGPRSLNESRLARRGHLSSAAAGRAQPSGFSCSGCHTGKPLAEKAFALSALKRGESGAIFGTWRSSRRGRADPFSWFCPAASGVTSYGKNLTRKGEKLQAPDGNLPPGPFPSE
jgi:hypothetical protein